MIITKTINFKTQCDFINAWAKECLSLNGAKWVKNPMSKMKTNNGLAFKKGSKNAKSMLNQICSIDFNAMLKSLALKNNHKYATKWKVKIHENKSK